MTSIYDQIGGQEALSAVVDEFYIRVLADSELAPYFAGANLNRLKGKQVEFFAGALGGPDHYAGLSMRDAHRGRGIGQAQFDRVATLLSESLLDAGVPQNLVDQILAAVAPLAGDIVSPTVPRP
ncbi:group I truncated hemoglobin [Amycolatopsis pithecellobii]|uniref:Group 1 truncated hemoglobin n=1 Tax=Amycolatopsis pithecellobii TaxID=664692 RepID=A0A6N7YRR6_9PSEU|nr:group 1 truncated hemoglobin [Amycolatopsis pithecellobii]MTD54652.1 group 1 truncated hemoglobin [Amycolatopsis pithecellobii]